MWRLRFEGPEFSRNDALQISHRKMLKVLGKGESEGVKLPKCTVASDVVNGVNGVLTSLLAEDAMQSVVIDVELDVDKLELVGLVS